MGMSEYAAAMGSLSGLAGSLGAFPMAGVSGHIAEMQGLGQHPVSVHSLGNVCFACDSPIPLALMVSPHLFSYFFV